MSGLLTLPLALAACNDDAGAEDAEPFDTLQDCYDEHHVEENLSVQKALVVCCLDHPISGVHPSCGATEADCVAHLDDEIDPSDPEVTTNEISAACATYIDEM